MSKNTKFYTITTIDTVPVSTAGTGTISTSAVDTKQVMGVGTTFLTQVQPNDFIFDAVTNKQIRRVQSVGSDTILYLDEAFSAPIVGGVFRIAVSKLAMINVIVPTGATGNIDNAAVTAVTQYKWSAADKRDLTSNPNLDPVVCEPTGGTWQIQTTE